MRRRLAALAAIALTLAGCERLDRAAFETRVRAYLLEHPEVIEQAVAELNRRRQVEADQRATAAVAANRTALERDARDYVANPSGRTTLTQFYDYRCPHCITAAPEVLALVRGDPDLRVVFKELPVFGGTSDRAARLALAVRQGGGDYLAAYAEMMAARPLDDAAVDALAARFGVAPAALDAPSAATTEHLGAVATTADRLGIDGTPTFVVGDRVIPGADFAAVRQAIAEARRRPAQTASGRSAAGSPAQAR